MSALRGLKVIELAHIMSGPTAGMLLADMGADVIKVERIPDGDDTRRFAPPLINGEAAAFLMMNRNKRGIALDLKTEGGKQILRRLARISDVLIENFRKGTMDRLGVGYDALKAINPALIYCAITGFGLTGPDADKGGFDLVAQGLSGLMSVTGEPDGSPVKVGSPVTDINAGMLAALGIVTAYVHRLRSGEGQLVDTSLLEAGVMQTYWQSAIYFGGGAVPGRLGSAHPLTAPYQAFATADGWITIGASNQANYKRLLSVLDLPELAVDERFQDNAARMCNLPTLIEALSRRLRERSSEEWLRALEEAGVPAGPVLSIAEVLAHPQVAARDMVVKTSHPAAGETAALGLPIKFSATPGAVQRPAPMFGEHTREVLRELAYSDEEIDGLVVDGAAYQA